MALWNGMGQAATIAQLAGMDAAGLISVIVQAVQTVQRNKVECQQLVNHVLMINDLLQLIQQSETMRRPEIRRPLDGLEDALRQAYMLVTSCQKSNIMYRFIMAGNQAQKFRDIRDRIDSYLHIYPLISHIDTRYFISGLYSGTHPSGAEPQASEEMLGSFTSHLNTDSRIEGSTPVGNDVQSEVQAGTDQLAIEVQKNDGYGSAKVFTNRKRQFRWLASRWIHTKASTRSIHRLIGHVEIGHVAAFKFSQLAASTNNFSSLNIIGKGGFGTVFKGVLPNGVDVAIKVSSNDTAQGLPEFVAEVLTIPKLQHANIVKLLGYCIKGDTRILVYEYICNGSLMGKISELRAGLLLSWPIRFRIIEGIVQGALYLNHHSRPRVVHGDLKTSNVVLDCDMTPRIIDFGLAVVMSSDEDEKNIHVVRGTSSYMDPKYLYTGVISIKSDVYAFGRILLNIITAQHTSQSQDINAWQLWSSGRAMELIDPALHNEPQIRDIVRCIQIALLCLQDYPQCRPTMSDVFLMLKCESITLPVPRSPGNILRLLRDSTADASETSGGNIYISAESTIGEEESLTYYSCCSSDVDDNTI